MSRIRIAALLAALALIPAVANAQSTITACYVPKTGSVYRIQAPGAPDACKTNHVEFSWSASAAPAAEATTIVNAFLLGPGTTGYGGAACPAGSVAVAGGFLVSSVGFQAWASRKNPVTAGWVVSGANTGANPVTVTVEAYCAPAAP